MNKREWERRAHLESVLLAHGFTAQEAEQLRRISSTLGRWHERECGDGYGCIERDEKTGRPYWYNANARYVDPHDPRARRPIPDRETGAKKRLAAILARRNSEGDVQEHANGGCTISKRAPLSAYIQTDPRGAALYILRPGDVPEGEDAGSYYTRGICVY